MTWHRFLRYWSVLPLVVILLGQLPASEPTFHRLPAVQPKGLQEPLSFDGIIWREPKETIRQLLWVENHQHRAQLAFGGQLGALKLASLDEPATDSTVELAEEPVLEPIAVGDPREAEPGCCWEPVSVCRPRPCWIVTADAFMLWRTLPREIKIVEEGTGTPPRGQRDALLTTNALRQDPAVGPRLSVSHLLTDHHRIEMTYFGLNHWSSQAAFDGADGVGFSFMNIDVPFDANITSDFDGGQFVNADYTSEIHSVEINARTDDRWDLNRSCGFPWFEYVDFLAGFRYFRLSEEFNLAAMDAGDTSNYLIDATNDMIGGQLGFIAGTYCSPTIRWNVVGKAGVYANLGEQSTFLGDDNNTVILRDFTTDAEEAAFLGQLDISIAHDIHPGAVIRGGYSLIWVDGVALAPEQLDFTTTPTSGSAINMNGGVLFHGLFAGLEIRH